MDKWECISKIRHHISDNLTRLHTLELTARSLYVNNNGFAVASDMIKKIESIRQAVLDERDSLIELVEKENE